jgi:dienelactone hydrolase
MWRLVCHRSSVVLVLLLACAGPTGAFQAAQSETRAEFVVLSEGRAIGTESVAISRTPDGWTLAAVEAIGPPLNLTTSRFVVRYGPDWRPLSLAIDGMLGNRALSLQTTFADGVARTQGTQQGEPLNVTHEVAPQAIILPAGFFASYSALAPRLGTAAVGTTLPLYILPQGQLTATVTRVTPRRFVAPSGAIDVRQFDLTLSTTGAPTYLEVWIDQSSQLARVAAEGSGLVIIRNDMSSAMIREETITRAGDQEVFIPALGFTIAATISRPAGAPARAPAVLMIGGAGEQDRDEVTARIPVFGHLANAIADAGFMVLRYDKRGVARSGGRTESATLADYAEDALGMVRWLRKRPDVDPNRIAVIGYAEGGAMALLAAAREDKIGAVGLLAAPGQTGREITLLQQQHALVASGASESDRQTRIAQQEQIIAATLKGTGWENVPPAIRRQADTPWFRSWLLFDPAAVVPKVKRPMLIVTGALDTQFPPSQADRLETLARARKKLPPAATQKVVVPGVNHLLVAARTGEAAEYAALAGSAVAPAVTSAVTDWLKSTLPPKK